MRRKLLLGLGVLAAIIAGVAPILATSATTSTSPTTSPTAVSGSIAGGPSAECAAFGGTHPITGAVKLDNPKGTAGQTVTSGSWSSSGAGITVTATSGTGGQFTSFTWTSTQPIQFVLVKSGDHYNVYNYVPGATSGTSESPYVTISGELKQQGISHITFCTGSGYPPNPCAQYPTLPDCDPCDPYGPIGEECSPCDDIGPFGAECNPCDDIGPLGEACDPCDNVGPLGEACDPCDQVGPFGETCNPCDQIGPYGEACEPCDEVGPYGADCDPCDEVGDFGEACDPCDQVGPYGEACDPCDQIGPYGEACDPCDQVGPYGEECDPCDQIGPYGEECDPCDEIGPIARGCVDDLTVVIGADGGFERTQNWLVEKSSDQTTVNQVGGTATITYTVTVKDGGSTDHDFTVVGEVAVANPNDTEAISGVDVAVSVPGGTCTSSDSGSETIAAGSSATFTYSCTFPGDPGDTLTVTGTATWDPDAHHTTEGSASADDEVTFGAPSVVINDPAAITDVLDGGPGTLLGVVSTSDTLPKTLTYQQTFPVPATGCTPHVNVVTVAGASATRTVNVCGPAAGMGHTMGFWQNKNGQAIVKAPATCVTLRTYLRSLAPFTDLSATASCAQTATYVTNVIKAASARGAAMNAMLKGQMLATALSVFFTDPAHNSLGATSALGSSTIDLTQVCKVISSCNGSYQNVGGAFGGATSLTVDQTLAYAATQFVSASSWYGQVKTTQEMAKNTFDAINNRVIFGA